MSDIVRLDEVCEHLFGLSPEIARRKAVLGILPVPAFRLNEGRKGPLFIKRADIAALVERRASGAGRLQDRMASVPPVPQIGVPPR